MKGIILLLFILSLTIEHHVHGQFPWREGEMEVMVTFRNTQEAAELNLLGLNGDIFSHAGYALLYVIPEELDLIRSSGFHYEILKSDLAKFSGDFWAARDQYHTYEEIIQTIDSLSVNYPAICQKYDYGLSVEGRQLLALKISDNVNTDENEAEVMFDGGIHGDEIGGPENLIRFAEFLCGSYGIDPDITYLIDHREIWLFIMVNPDGRVNLTRYNSNAVDLNRDWGYMWKGEGSSPGYYSQVETRALRNCMMDNQFVVHTSYHSGTEFLAYTWSYRPDPCPDQAHIHQLAGVYASASGYSNLPYEQGYTGMYAINGSSKDAIYGVMGSIGWTMEISHAKQPPSSQIQYYYDINEPAMIAMIEYAGYGISGTIADAGTGEPVAAAIFINDFYPCYSDPIVGDYHKYLLDGTYSVTAVANGYQPMTQTVEITENGNISLDFSLQAEYNHNAYRVIASYLQYSNFADESMTYAALGEPDGFNYSLGKSGWIILDMQFDIIDGFGDDITIHEGDGDPEGFACYAASGMDGPWKFLGNGIGTTSFDFAPAGITQARYIRIVDDGDGPIYGDNTGFDLDAIVVPEQLQIIYLVIDCLVDDPLGNGNGRIDSGEEFDLVVTLSNLGGMTMENGQAYLNYDHTFLSTSNPELSIGDLDYGESVQLTFTMNCSSFCPPGELLMMVLNVTSNEGTNQQSFPLNFSAGAIVEDWETGNFTKFNWSATGNKPWAIYFLDPYQGTYSAKSGNISDNQSSGLELTLDVIGYDDISFYRKVSSEAGKDFLRFYMDNTLIDQWSGEQGWEYCSYQVKPGIHTFRWAYEKDNSNSQGADGGWLDYIVFPSSNLNGTLKALANAIPHELCSGTASQLGAYVIGGSGNYSYAWAPSSMLNDSTLQFPLATPPENTIFSLSVNDGENVVASATEVMVNPLPETPVVQQAGDSLISTAAEGNQWYSDDGPVTGANGQVFYPEAEGDYFVIVTNDSGCESDTSNLIHFLFTGISENMAAPAILIYPNPFGELLNIHFTRNPGMGTVIKIIDILGKEIIIQELENPVYQNAVVIPMPESINGLFLISIIDREGKILVSRKLIKK
jgi:hypothetical protein